MRKKEPSGVRHEINAARNRSKRTGMDKIECGKLGTKKRKSESMVFLERRRQSKKCYGSPNRCRFTPMRAGIWEDESNRPPDEKKDGIREIENEDVGRE